MRPLLIALCLCLALPAFGADPAARANLNAFTASGNWVSVHGSLPESYFLQQMNPMQLIAMSCPPELVPTCEAAIGESVALVASFAALEGGAYRFTVLELTVFGRTHGKEER